MIEKMASVTNMKVTITAETANAVRKSKMATTIVTPKRGDTKVIFFLSGHMKFICFLFTGNGECAYFPNE
jgi:hypothetical protein